MATTAQLDRALNPKSVVVVGDTRRGNYHWLKSMSTIKSGRLYSVQIAPDDIPGIEALGIPNYSSVTEVPGEVDYVLVAVPRAVAPRVLQDCITKGVGCVAMFTSGFAETETEEGVRLQEQLTQMARDSGIVLIGPNCMGLYNPDAGVRFSEGQPSGFEGDVAFLSQSGGHTGDFITTAFAAGVPVRRAVSFGNGIVLEHPDYLEYFAQDEGTRAISMYVEGIQDGPRFFRVLRDTARRKPVVLWKGGLTDAGGRATASHTASLAGSEATWKALARQTGAIPAGSITESVDLLKALRMLPPFTGTGLGITGGSGGQSVAMSDVFSRAGLSVPMLSEASLEKLGAWFRVVGASFGNPIDMGSNRSEIEGIIQVLADDTNVDCVVMQIRPESGDDGRDAARLEAQLTALAKGKELAKDKPVVAIMFSSNPFEEGPALARLDARLREIGIPGYPTYERAAAVIAKVSAYYRFRQSLE
jgi:acyl-CoA synthetase (NDP forming)